MAKQQRTAHKISYCTTCKGRTFQLKETLRANMEMEAGNPNVEFVVLDYDSRDGLQEWLAENFSEELKSGRLVYGRHAPAEHFHFAHAKNLAHRLASGDILCNLDADNFLAPGYSQWLDKQFTKHPHSVVTPQLLTASDMATEALKRVALKQAAPTGGLGGRLALRSDDFIKLGGYDERIEGWAGDDLNLALRARDAGLRCVITPPRMYGEALPHGHDLRTAELAPEARAQSHARLNRPTHEKVLATVEDRLRKAPPLLKEKEHAAGEITGMPPELLDKDPNAHVLTKATPPRREWRKTLTRPASEEPSTTPPR